MRQTSRFLLYLLTSLLISCGGPSVKDGPPPREIDVSKIPDAVPRVEPITRAGNKSPYTVLGRTYRVLPTSSGYREQGLASWYGNKFHGRKTSNGETYNMYAMTAAHKTLPIPSYVRVTNLANGRQVIVRVNDRGPFHSERIIDLSYAAAKKLGFYQNGTGRVEVTAIDPAAYQRNTVASPAVEEKAYRAPEGIAAEVLPANTFFQAGAFSSRAAARETRDRVAVHTDHPVAVKERHAGGKTLFKVLVGPITDNTEMVRLRSVLLRAENLEGFVVYD